MKNLLLCIAEIVGYLIGYTALSIGWIIENSIQLTKSLKKKGGVL